MMWHSHFFFSLKYIANTIHTLEKALEKQNGGLDDDIWFVQCTLFTYGHALEEAVYGESQDDEETSHRCDKTLFPEHYELRSSAYALIQWTTTFGNMTSSIRFPNPIDPIPLLKLKPRPCFRKKTVGVLRNDI